MSVKTFNFKDAVPSGATLHRSLQDGGSVTAATTGTGWVAATLATGQSCLMVGGTEVARNAATWGTTLQPSAAVSTTLGDCWRSENTLSGTFANSNWVATFGFRSVTAAYAGRLKLAMRLYRSTNASGAGATEITSGRVVSAATSANLSTSADTTLTCTWSPGATQTFAGEYLFVQVGIEVTSAGGGTTQDFDFRVSSAGGYALVTPDLAFNDGVTESGSAADSPSNLATFVAAKAETGAAGETTGAVFTTLAAGSESGSALDGVNRFPVISATMPESATAAETTSFPAPVASVQDESATALDAPTAQVDFISARAETGTAAETAANVTTFAAARPETGTAADTPDATTGTGRLVLVSWAQLQAPEQAIQIRAETASAAETVSNTTVFAAAIAEAGSALETATSAVPKVLVSWAQLQAPEQPNTTKSASIAETASAAETSDVPEPAVRISWAMLQAPAGYLPTVAEVAAAIEVVAPHNVTAVSVAESASAVASQNGAFPGVAQVLVSWAALQAPAGGLLVARAETAAAVDTVTSGSTFSADVSDSWSFADSLVQGIGSAASITETAAAAESINATAPTASRAEVAGIADTLSASVVFLAAQPESANALETIIAPTSANAIVTELGAALDTTTGTGPGIGVSGAVLEVAGAVDSPFGGYTTAAAITEVAAATNFTSFSGAQISAIDGESALAIDALVASNVTIDSHCAESATPVDVSNNAGVVLSNGVGESGSATDASACSIVFHGSIAEGTASATDVESALAVWVAFVGESGSATSQSTTGNQAAFATALETAAATDTSNGVNSSSAISESASATNTTAATLVSTSAISEIVFPVADSSTTGALVQVAVFETALSSESTNAVNATGITVESASAQEQVAAAASWATFIAETGTAADSSDFTRFIFFTGVTETAVAVETPGAIQTRGAAVTEVTASADTLDVADSTRVGDVLEVGNALDVAVAGALIDESIVESCTAIDASHGSGIGAPIEDHLWIRSSISNQVDLWYRSASSKDVLTVRSA